MSVQTNVRFDQEAIARFQGEPEWLTRLRQEGINGYQQLPLPKLEKTKIDKWNMDEFVPYKEEAALASLDELPQEAKDALAPDNGNVMVQKHSSVVYVELSAALKEQGVLFMPLEQAARQHGELVKKYLFQSGIERHKVTALHQALWGGGFFVYVPKNVEVNEPLQLIVWGTDEDVALLPHTLIVADVNSKVTVVENVIGANYTRPVVVNGMVEIFAEGGAKVQYASLRSLAEQVTDYTHRRGITANDARIEWLLGDMNHGNTVANTTTILKGNGSSTDIKSVAMASGGQKENFVSRVVHVGTHTESNILARGVMLDEATAIFNGITEIKKGAQKANGEQAENILMVGERARGDANPILLIDEDDVMAGHAASVGPVSPLQVYYMMSRGVKRQEAERLIINGFLAPVLDHLPIEGMQKRLSAMIEGKLSS
ncbi:MULTISPECIES: Fe-S cluster assembly protein SufD [Aneurinibacillus]|uniref:Fe-S cluster assembly protein SufD n=1 Tax=Aneurinibacillus thermoaerophilus TaxID=143495 RepID=A0A1G8CJI6_ANETH|nr:MULTISPECIES: Fe-S cluster assembly protein SufD [Aneurinibacillus]AMA71942.1 Fe-S cluster assembly protein SufD [Aneurinibacillus sp. XH2]MED0680272.1 Fe-S cluster assembly protein SufD [Aneurinibacillus thermoaerophilus]MED0737101.1 Fe-S cluster assembly protein SufD [Aneurinibacillus thermoaerophilus]MED0758717.1 Fe-S cluster assembly protein SufD [Aneurinibacillus thermoaerophilus]MED0761649.1 Fe-S cluster assembly protein SufD [Aneurinibacillus thermoaerophilus]